MISIVSTAVSANHQDQQGAPLPPNRDGGLGPDSRPNSFSVARKAALAAMEGGDMVGTPRSMAHLGGKGHDGSAHRTEQEGDEDDQQAQQNARFADGDSDDEDELPQQELEELLLPDEEIQALVQKVFTYDLIGNNPQWARYFNFSSSTTKEDEEEALLRKEAEEARTCMAKWRSNRLRSRIYVLLSHPESSRAAYCMSIFMLGIIILNTITFCLESVPQYENSELYDRLVVVDYACLGIFTVEFLVRIITCHRIWGFCKSPMNIIDFVSIFPFFVELIIAGPGSNNASQTRILRLIRLLRILRLLRVASKFQNLQVVVDALVASLDVLSMLAFLLLVLLVVFSTVLYYIESTQPGTLFDSIPAVMWYTQVTLTTTGYGDMVPTTNWGKFVAGITMLCCMVTISLPISVIGGNFSTMWSEYRQIKDAADRSAEVWPNFQKLKVSLSQHQVVLEDVLECVKETQALIDKEIVTLREDLQQARLQYSARMEEGKTPGWQTDVEELKSACASMKTRLETTRDRWEELEAVMGISSLAQADDFVGKLDRLHAGNKALRKWSEEGMYMVDDVQTLAADLQALKAFLNSDAQQQQVGATVGNPAPAQ